MTEETPDLETVADLWSLPIGRYRDWRSDDDFNLTLQVNGTNARSWIMRHKGKWHGIGSLKDTPLRKARMKAGALLLRLEDGEDPIAERKQEREVVKAAKMAAVSGKSFKDAG